jgi:hypothetical protein
LRCPYCHKVVDLSSADIKTSAKGEEFPEFTEFVLSMRKAIFCKMLHEIKKVVPEIYEWFEKNNDV